MFSPFDDILLLRRRQPVFWQSVTGCLEAQSELPIDAARREVFEETGIDRSHGWVDWNISRFFRIPKEYEHRFAPGTAINQEHMFSLQLPSRLDVTLNTDEHSDSQWLDFESSKQKIWSWTNRAAINLVQRTLILKQDV